MDPQVVPMEWCGDSQVNYPEVVPETWHSDVDARYPMAVQQATLYNTPPPLPRTPLSAEGGAPLKTPESFIKNDTADEKAPLPSRPRKIFGMRRKAFWIAFGILAVIIIGAVAGGVAGSLTSKKNTGASAGGRSNSNSSTSTSSTASATATISGAVPSSSKVSIHAIAAAAAISKNLVNYTCLAYQNTSDWIVLFRYNSGNGEYGSTQALSLPLTPIEQTPFAATGTIEPSGTSFNIFYIDNAFQICNVNISCPFDASNNGCFIRNVTQISTSLATTISEHTSLAAEYLGAALGWRVFYQDEHNIPSVTASVSGDSPWDKGAIVGQEALSGSSLASTTESSGNMTLFYISNSNGSIEMVTFDQATGKWMDSTQLTNQVIPNFDDSSAALAASSGNAGMELFYLGNDKQIYEYWQKDKAWTGTSAHAHEWALNDAEGGRIAVIAWDDQIRIYYESDGEVVMNPSLGSGWSNTSGV